MGAKLHNLPSMIYERSAYFLHMSSLLESEIQKERAMRSDNGDELSQRMASMR